MNLEDYLTGYSIIKLAPSKEEQKYEREHPEDHLHKAHPPPTLPLYDKPFHIEMASLDTGIPSLYHPPVRQISSALLPARQMVSNPYILNPKPSVALSFAKPQYIVSASKGLSPVPTSITNSKYAQQIPNLPTPFDEPRISQRESNRSMVGNTPWSNGSRRPSLHSRHASLPPYLAVAPEPLNLAMVSMAPNKSMLK